jgi:predicted Zn-dependent protease
MPWSQMFCRLSVHATFTHENGHRPKEASTLNRQILAGGWLSVLFALSVFAPGQPPTATMPRPGLPSTPTPQQAIDNQILAPNSLAQPWGTTLPSIHGTDPNSPNPDACSDRAADRSDRQLRAEWISGRKLAADAERHLDLISDPYISEYLNRLEQVIVLNSQLKGCFVVKLVNDVEANAYSFPGGFLYVTSGMILDAENEAQLVAALAHETGHVAARHFSKMEARKRFWRRLSLAGGPGHVLGWPIGSLLTYKLLRNAEFEADRLALKYQTASGYDPLELARLLQDLFEQEGKPASYFTRLFDTHPSTNTRIMRVTQAANRLRYQTDSLVDTSEFHDVKRQVADVMGVTDPDLLPH